MEWTQRHAAWTWTRSIDKDIDMRQGQGHVGGIFQKNAELSRNYESTELRGHTYTGMPEC
jgi:hypothetical protein